MFYVTWRTMCFLVPPRDKDLVWLLWLFLLSQSLRVFSRDSYIRINQFLVCLSELIQTEFHHVRTLRIMEGVYRRGMQEEVMLEPGVVHTIFPCLDQLLELHSSFLSELLNRRKEGLMEGSSNNFTVRSIGDLLLRQVPQLSPLWGLTRWLSVTEVVIVQDEVKTYRIMVSLKSRLHYMAKK